ncbi:MAG TPA: nitroreductase family protein [Gemmatimonadales bacterium]|nr:nitroreductase family protein [Gemmatimonadales bacterium]
MATHVELEREHGTLDAIYHRRAVRSYTPEKLDESTIRRLLETAVQAPTAMHLEPWAFVVIQDVALLARLSDPHPNFSNGVRGPQGTDTILQVRMRGVPVEEAPSRIEAATFHGLKVMPVAGGLEADVVLDV